MSFKKGDKVFTRLGWGFVDDFVPGVGYYVDESKTHGFQKWSILCDEDELRPWSPLEEALT